MTKLSENPGPDPGPLQSSARWLLGEGGSHFTLTVWLQFALVELKPVCLPYVFLSSSEHLY